MLRITIENPPAVVECDDVEEALVLLGALRGRAEPALPQAQPSPASAEKAPPTPRLEPPAPAVAPATGTGDRILETLKGSSSEGMSEPELAKAVYGEATGASCKKVRLQLEMYRRRKLVATPAPGVWVLVPKSTKGGRPLSATSIAGRLREKLSDGKPHTERELAQVAYGSATGDHVRRIRNQLSQMRQRGQVRKQGPGMWVLWHEDE